MQHRTNVDGCNNLIYRATFPNGKSYIGQTTNFDRRQRSHVANVTESETRAFRRAIKKYGVECIVWETLEFCEEHALDAAEMFWIAWYDTRTPNGYNMTEGGKSGKRTQPVTAETREKLRVARLGKKLSDETKAKLSVFFTGYKHTEESRQNMSASRRGKKRASLTDERKRQISEQHRGLKHTEETREKMSKSRTGKKLSEETRAKIRDAWTRRKMTGTPLPEELK